MEGDKKMANAIVTRPKSSVVLPDNTQYTNRFEIRSESSNRVYTVAQHKTGRWWSCSCPGWIRHRKCKHLSAMGLPIGQRPYEATLVAR